MTTAPVNHSSHTKIYIVIATLVIGAIVVLLLMNDENFSFTGAITGESGTVIPVVAPLIAKGPTGANTAVETVFKSEVDKGGKDVDLGLTFSEIPEINIVDAKDIESIVLDFTTEAGVSRSINVNKDRLELTDLRDIKLEIRNFKGNIHIAKHADLSLDGTATQIDVNGVGLHSGSDMKISLRDLDFDALHITEIELNDLQLPSGNGLLEVGEKLNYALQDDSMSIYYFKGNMNIEDGATDAFRLEGEARGISASGDLLTLNLR